MIKKFLMGFGFLALLAVLLGIGSCCVSCQGYSNQRNAIPIEVMRGTLQPVKDCFGVVIDYTMNGMSLIDSGICWDRCDYPGNDCKYALFIEKVDNRDYDKFYLNEYQENKVYIIYKRSGSYLWSRAEQYYIGCE